MQLILRKTVLKLVLGMNFQFPLNHLNGGEYVPLVAYVIPIEEWLEKLLAAGVVTTTIVDFGIRVVCCIMNLPCKSDELNWV